MFPAKNGDSLLITLMGDENTNLLVDGGYGVTYRNSIRRKLKNLASEGEAIDLLIATHIDSDHIGGLIALLRENENAASAKVIPIQAIWHNSLSCLVSDSMNDDDLSAPDTELLEGICRRGMRQPEDGTTSEISAAQGSSLASLIRSGNYLWNANTSIMAGHSREINSDWQIRVIGPPIERLTSLREWWIAKIRGLGFDSELSSSPLMQNVFEFLSSYQTPLKETEEISGATEDAILSDIYKSDKSVTNGSSISFVLQGNNKKILFLGDSWAEDAISGLDSLAHDEGIEIFDAIKVSHHGSYRNTSPELLSRVDSEKYLISTDGSKHSHPDWPVLRAIVDRPAEFTRSLIFNYRTEIVERIEAYQSNAAHEFDVVVKQNEPIQL